MKDMKTQLFIIVSVLFAQQLLKAQTSYMPVFADTTRYYWSMQGIDGSSHSYYDYIRKNDSIIIPACLSYDSLLVNKTNSTIWVMKADGFGNPLGKFLVMDLDLQVGDQYTDQQGIIHTVDSVYSKANRKHVRFEKKHNVAIGISTPGGAAAVDSLHFEFIEGVGNNICFGEGTISNPAITWLRVQYKDGLLSYGIPEWFPCWDQYVGYQTEVTEITDNKLRLSPSPAISKLHVEIPNTCNLNNLVLNIYDINGKQHYTSSPTDRSTVIDVSKFTSGVYIMQLRNQDFNETVKFVKSQPR